MTLVLFHSIEIRRALVGGLLALFLMPVGSAVADDRGSPADQEACTPDVFRLCNEFIPDEKAIVACLLSKRDQLSPACNQVFGPPVDAPRRRRHH